HDITSGGSTVEGIRSTSSSPSIFNNKIYNITTNSTSGMVAGIGVSSLGTAGSATIYNNLIGDLFAPTVSSATDAVRGISVTATTGSSTVNVYHNTVYLNTTSTGTNFSTSAMYATTSSTATSAALTLNNNIFVNLSTANGSGNTAAFRRSSATLTNFHANSNNNLYYAGKPSIKNLIYAGGTSDVDSVIGTYKTRMATRDQASVSEAVNFASTNSSDANYLAINTANATQTESGGTATADIAFDFTNNVRAGHPGYPSQI